MLFRYDNNYSSCQTVGNVTDAMSRVARREGQVIEGVRFFMVKVKMNFTLFEVGLIYIYLYFRSLFLTPLFVLETKDINDNFTVKTL